MSTPNLAPSSLLILTLLALPSAADAQTNNYPNGSMVADFTVTDVDGDLHTLYDLTAQGKYVFLDFFTLWCVPCQETAPSWAELYQTYGCNGGDVYCLSLDYEPNTVAEIHAYSETFGGGWAHPPVVSGALGLSDVFGVGTAPNYCLIGPDNVMINNFIWPVSSMADFVAALPDSSGVVPFACETGVRDGASLDPGVYPNPTSGRVWVNDRSSALVQVSDASGRVIAQAPVIRGAIELPVSGSGLYVLSFFDARGHSRGRARVLRL